MTEKTPEPEKKEQPEKEKATPTTKEPTPAKYNRRRDGYHSGDVHKRGDRYWD